MVAAHQECIRMSIIIHLREAEAGANGKRFGDHMETPNLEPQKQIDRAGIRDGFCYFLSERNLGLGQSF